MNRPKDKADRKTYYSGKKKAHTLKHNVITERGGKVDNFRLTHRQKRTATLKKAA